MGKVQTQKQFCGLIQYSSALYSTFILERERERSISEAHCFADFEACKRERERERDE